MVVRLHLSKVSQTAFRKYVAMAKLDWFVVAHAHAHASGWTFLVAVFQDSN